MHQRSDGRWAASIEVERGLEGRRKRKWFYGSTQREVIAKKRAYMEAQSQGIRPGDERLTVGQFLEEWLTTMILPSGRAASTKADYTDIVRLHLVPALGHIRLARLSALDIERYVLAKRTTGRTVRTASGYSASTIRYHHAVLRTALAKAVRLGLIPRNVAQHVTVEAPRRDPRVVHALDDDQLQAFLAAARPHRLYALFLVLAGLGLRRGEALGVRWADVNLEQGLLTVEQQVQRVRGRGLLIVPIPKTRASHRTIHLPPICLHALKEHRHRQRHERLAAGPRWRDHDLVFPSSIGTPMEPRNLTRILHRLCEEAGIPRERLHNLRHTAATIGYAQGLGDVEIQRMVGHQRPSTTRDLYVHAVPALGREAADRLSEVLGGKPRHLRVTGMPPASGDLDSGLHADA